MLAGGVFTMVASLFFTWVFSMAGVFHSTATRNPTTGEVNSLGDAALVPIFIVLFVAGLGMTGFAVFSGLRYSKRAYGGPKETIDNAFIVARYGVDRNGYVLTQDYQIEGCDRPRYYVRMQLPNAIPSEFECEPAVFYQCGEGMTGQATVQGKWLGSFIPYIGIPPES